MYQLLKKKGYNGPDNLESMVSWLNTCGIYIDFYTVWDEEGAEVIGYQVYIFLPPYKSTYKSQPYNSYRDALESTLYKLIDYLN